MGHKRTYQTKIKCQAVADTVPAIKQITDAFISSLDVFFLAKAHIVKRF